ncbi:MAG: hypothetical protein A2X35_05220 [Elusimicrobia bacterium GWA2_61_42]|nr:MAG: hypothetical protein A2X35_05220 [Elusimicrobia bacterium GWA2_61_42]OGR74226.1 MAG: hypothetical protein A2X38_11445 [Elusimicrobia bacterium GWC2_61_25]
MSLLLPRLALVCLFAASPAFAYEDTLTTAEIEGALENTKLSEVFSQYLATLQMYDPERATRLGLHGSDHSLTPRTPERLAKQLEVVKRLRVKLGEIRKDSMAPDLKVDYETLDHMLEVDIYEMEKSGVLARKPQYYLEPFFLVYQMMSRDYEDYNTRSANALSRLKQFPGLLEQAERNLSHPPELWTRQAIKQASDALNYVSDFVPVFRGYTRADTALKAQVDETMGKVKIALARYAAFLEKDILPVSDGEMRAGDYTYGFYLERLHALDMTPGSALRYSKKAFKQSMKDLDKEARNIDSVLAGEKGWKGVLDKLPKEHPPAAEVLKVFQDEMDRAYQHFDEHKVVEFPRQRLLIKRMPGFMASVLPYVYYAPSFSLDDNRISELFVLLPPDKAPEAAREKTLAAGFNYAQVELLTSYAIMPGMHLRGFEASSNRSRIRRISRQPVVSNGWACYSELLAEEMGYYSSYWSRFLRCYVRALRAARAYADAALHTKKWTPVEASLFFQKNLHLTKGQADAEVVRLSLSPTDGLSYIVGMDRILEMRGYYERTEAKYFDLRKFHTLFLRMGEIPIERIADEMRRQKREEKKIIR